jgi:hypothetical protein
MTQRTGQQQKSIEVYCRELANALNDAGLEMKEVLAVKQVDVPWTQKTVKEVLWKPLQEIVTDDHKKSTTQLDIMEVDRVYNILDRHIAQHFGVHVEFPSKEQVEHDIQNEFYSQKRGNI